MKSDFLIFQSSSVHKAPDSLIPQVVRRFVHQEAVSSSSCDQRQITAVIFYGEHESANLLRCDSSVSIFQDRSNMLRFHMEYEFEIYRGMLAFD